MRKLRIDLSKVPEEVIYHGKNGAQYVTVILMENRNGQDQYGWDGFAKLDVSKEDRLAGVQGEIVGNWKELQAAPKAEQKSFPKRQYSMPPKGSPPARKPAPPRDSDLDAGQDDIPF